MRSIPYQPLMLRLLHGLNALLVLAAFMSGFLVYDSWDGRWGGLDLTKANRNLIDIHGTFGFLLFFILIGFAIYSVRFGKHRLVAKNSLSKLRNVGKPSWWYALHRIANTVMLAAAGLSVITGKFQDENWLPQGQMNQPAYFLHLTAWVLIGLALTFHLLLTAKVGGIPLWQSMIQTDYRSPESPKLWPQKIKNWFRHPRW
ncbi:cytochrome b/b6 domain-containing protein [Laspinema sp. A4]|uniref:cytochrome b/b6 domain-containing protein n=1 Tax=Laspinema sp. D2d TaxID=2953686 RepID=UPI0021BA3F9B|nr:cytochrome b/b6 domain-containing protein [Laspinema sp. D2d]MCT7985434.1 cytochrome b/b6 domain-containing protein [Laspinema sp. D2d]